MRRAIVFGLLLSVPSSLVLAQAPPSASTETVQQVFDAATGAIQAERWSDALSRFETLERRIGARNPRTLAVIRIRMALALVELGRVDEARQRAEQGLAALPADDPTLVADRFEALTLLGRIAEALLDYAAAANHYRAATALGLPEEDKLIARRGLIQTQLFDQPEAAVREADAALAIIAAGSERNRHLEGQFRTLKGRALLNLRRFADARRELETALRLLGNLTLRVDRADLMARGDLALAALLTGDQSNARRYLAYTGQGRFQRGSIPTGPQYLPACGERLHRDDVAVVEFAIDSSGVVGQVMPIYASRGGPVALDFAQAVRYWRFDPAAVADIPPLLRSVVRVELRCTELRNRLPHLQIPDIGDFVHERPLRSLPDLRAALADAERGNAPLMIVRALIALADHPTVDKLEAQALLRRALTVAAAADLDGRLIAGLAIRSADSAILEPREDRAELETLAGSEPLRGHPTAAAAIRLVRASALYANDQPEAANALAVQLAASTEIRGHAALAGEAAALLAAIRAAQAAPETPATRCLVAPPSRRTSASSADFPQETLRWGFEGWASIEPIVAPDGQVASTRALIAYPPFVFGDSAIRIVQRGRYDRGSTSAACPAERVTVRFLLP